MTTPNIRKGPSGPLADFELTTDDVENTSTVTGITATDALETLQAAQGGSPSVLAFADDFDLIGTADPSAIATAGANLPTGSGNWCARAVTASGLCNLQNGVVANHPGTVDIQTSSTINSIVLLQRGIANTSSGVFINANQIEQCTTIARLNVITTIRTQIGISATISSTAPSAAALFVFDSSVSANWLCICRLGGVQTLVDSAIPVVAAQYYNLQIKQAVLGTFTFEVDGIEVTGGGISTNVPSSTVNVGVMVQTLVGATRSLTVDYFSLTSKKLTR